MSKASARSCANIAFIKYWGNLNHDLRLAASPSLSMNLADLYTTATVHFDPRLNQDELFIQNEPASAQAAQRVFRFIDIVRTKAGLESRVRVNTSSNFPAGAGIASSAAAFSVLAKAAAAAAGLDLTEAALSALARRGSGSACRSIPNGYCQWLEGGTDAESYATSIAPSEHWDLCDIVAVVSPEPKQTGSSEGHRLADSSDLQAARLKNATTRFKACKAALLQRDLATLGPIIEEDTLMMHSVMMTSRPPLYYWLPGTLEIMGAVQRWRLEGLPVYFTIDAGPNVHLICEAHHAAQVSEAVLALASVQKIYRSHPGGPASLISG